MDTAGSKVFCVGSGIDARKSTIIQSNGFDSIRRVAEAEAVLHELHMRIEGISVFSIP